MVDSINALGSMLSNDKLTTAVINTFKNEDEKDLVWQQPLEVSDRIKSEQDVRNLLPEILRGGLIEKSVRAIIPEIEELHRSYKEFNNISENIVENEERYVQIPITVSYNGKMEQKSVRVPVSHEDFFSDDGARRPLGLVSIAVRERVMKIQQADANIYADILKKARDDVKEKVAQSLGADASAANATLSQSFNNTDEKELIDEYQINSEVDAEISRIKRDYKKALDSTKMVTEAMGGVRILRDSAITSIVDRSKVTNRDLLASAVNRIERVRQVQLNLLKERNETGTEAKRILKPYKPKEETKPLILIQQKGSTDPIWTTDQFLLQSVTEMRNEKFQVIETFGGSKIFFFDERARIYNYSISVFNDNGGSDATGKRNKFGRDWKNQFVTAYVTMLRGTKCVENESQCVIQYDGRTRVGYLLSCSMVEDANNDDIAQITFSMYVENADLVDLEGDPVVFQRSSSTKRDREVVKEITQEYTSTVHIGQGTRLDQSNLSNGVSVINGRDSKKVEFIVNRESFKDGNLIDPVDANKKPDVPKYAGIKFKEVDVERLGIFAKHKDVINAYLRSAYSGISKDKIDFRHGSAVIKFQHIANAFPVEVTSMTRGDKNLTITLIFEITSDGVIENEPDLLRITSSVFGERLILNSESGGVILKHDTVTGAEDGVALLDSDGVLTVKSATNINGLLDSGQSGSVASDSVHRVFIGVVDENGTPTNTADLDIRIVPVYLFHTSLGITTSCIAHIYKYSSDNSAFNDIKGSAEDKILIEFVVSAPDGHGGLFGAESSTDSTVKLFSGELDLSGSLSGQLQLNFEFEFPKVEPRSFDLKHSPSNNGGLITGTSRYKGVGVLRLQFVIYSSLSLTVRMDPSLTSEEEALALLRASSIDFNIPAGSWRYEGGKMRQTTKQASNRSVYMYVGPKWVNTGGNEDGMLFRIIFNVESGMSLPEKPTLHKFSNSEVTPFKASTLGLHRIGHNATRNYTPIKSQVIKNSTQFLLDKSGNAGVYSVTASLNLPGEKSINSVWAGNGTGGINRTGLFY